MKVNWGTAAGTVVEAQQNGKVIADAILKGALLFIEQQPMPFFVAWTAECLHLCCSGIRLYKAIDPQTIDVDLN